MKDDFPLTYRKFQDFNQAIVSAGENNNLANLTYSSNVVESWLKVAQAISASAHSAVMSMYELPNGGTGHTIVQQKGNKKQTPLGQASKKPASYQGWEKAVAETHRAASALVNQTVLSVSRAGLMWGAGILTGIADAIPQAVPSGGSSQRPDSTAPKPQTMNEMSMAGVDNSAAIQNVLDVIKPLYPEDESGYAVGGNTVYVQPHMTDVLESVQCPAGSHAGYGAARGPVLTMTVLEKLNRVHMV